MFYLSDCTAYIPTEGAGISNSYIDECPKDDASCVETRWSSQSVSVTYLIELRIEGLVKKKKLIRMRCTVWVT